MAANHYTLPSPIAESTISFLLYLRCIEDELGRSLTTPEKNRAVVCFLANCEVSEAALFITAHRPSRREDERLQHLVTIVADSRVNLIALGRELAGLSGRYDLSDEEYRSIALEWLECYPPMNHGSF